MDLGDDPLRDEDLDTSYEALMELSGLLGEVRPRGLSEQAIASLPSGTYSEWATPGETEERCPICLDDYNPEDPVLKLPACSHWFHRGCLEQWLKSARTCPVCRGRVGSSDARHGLRPSGSASSAGPSAGPSANPPAGRRRRGGYPPRTRPPRPDDRREGGNDSDGDVPPFPLPPWRYS
ncbi:hypothetical protein FOMPIDRAFT_1032121 [Fomitopsis schrenkii]|uniref:RING-type domain-containing protein n=1 Tax=Fomitopsis schrenkii TaxID=2126942 RepID=S8DX13_FOMSC|nr:hypothetical protein FOMPIDRAFT_1032121 [Fomitopsis schrenkii]